MVNPDIEAHIRKQYYEFFKEAHDNKGKVQINGIFDKSRGFSWPVNKKISIKVNGNKMERVPAHGFTSYFTKKSNQNRILDELIEDYNSTDDKKAFIDSLENIKVKTVTSESMRRVLDPQLADPQEAQRIASLLHQEYGGGKKSRKLRKNKKRKTRRKNKKRKTKRKK